MTKHLMAEFSGWPGRWGEELEEKLPSGPVKVSAEQAQFL